MDILGVGVFCKRPLLAKYWQSNASDGMKGRRRTDLGNVKGRFRG
jgi:hypothetical protein